MRVFTRPRHRNAGRPADKDARGFLQWIRTRPCVFADEGECGGNLEVMHLDYAGKMEGVPQSDAKGTSTKVADRYSVPACSIHHAWQHLWGWDTFCERMGTTKEKLMIAAARLWNAWPSRVKWERERAA